MKPLTTGETVPYSNEALFRYSLVSMVLTREQQAGKRSQAIRDVSKETHRDMEGNLRKVSTRSLYRWLNRFEAEGFDGLQPTVRKPNIDSSVVPEELISFCRQQKEDDPLASIPEILLRAKEKKVINTPEKINRTTLWRCLKRHGIDTQRVRYNPASQDKRRFAYPHRMDMVLCDGKHFRAGAGRLRRVALFFLDDATRFGLTVVVGTSETTELFLRGVYECYLNYGDMSRVFVDNGSGFKAGESMLVLQQLNTRLIRGTAGYPEGRGKIERFNRTALMQCLRHLNNDSEVDPDISALELRLRHYLHERYNQTPHESLNSQTPWERFHTDSQRLCPKENLPMLKQAFVIPYHRKVSGDNIIKLKGNAYEMPAGYAKQKVIIHYNVLEPAVTFNHQGREIILHLVDLHANAVRKPTPKSAKHPNTTGTPVKSSAQMSFEHAYRPIIDKDGGYSDDQP